MISNLKLDAFERMEVATEEPVLVTGACSFVGSNLIQLLLARGYRVRGTVRDITASAEYISELRLRTTGYEEQLEIISANLLDQTDENWERAFDGVEYVFHLASPHSFKPQNPQQELIQPAVEGTRRILQMCQKSTTVKKLIFLSCYLALTDEFDSSRTYTEDDWNETSTISRNAYAYSKTMAEKLATAFCSQPGCRFTFVSLLPGMIWGPALVPRLSHSHKYLKLFLDGTSKVLMNLHYTIVDVRDVSNALIMSMEKPHLLGRYCLTHDAMELSEILQTVHENFPDITTIPTRKLRDFVVKTYLSTSSANEGRYEFVCYHLSRTPQVVCAKAEAAGMLLRPTNQTILDTVRYFQDHGYLEDEVRASIGGGCTVQ